MLFEVLGIFFLRRRRRGPVVPNAPKPISRPQEEARLRRTYKEWASQNGLRRLQHGYGGRLGGHEVVVRHGLDGSAPIGVEAEITIEHDEPATFLFTPKRRADPEAKSDVGEALVPLFDDPALAALRSIAVIKDGVRLGFTPLTGPDVVQSAIDASILAIEERLRARPRDNAYR